MIYTTVVSVPTILGSELNSDRDYGYPLLVSMSASRKCIKLL